MDHSQKPAINMRDKRAGFFRLLSGVVLVMTISLSQPSPVFPAEDVKKLMARGDEALARGDYELALLCGAGLMTEDPGNIRGYEFAMISFAMTGRESKFYAVVNAAKKQGLSELTIDHLAAAVLFLAGRSVSANHRLSEYEMKWREIYDKTR